ncbi:hypothetical protein IEO21_07383 [Rhodonia placenta]|uniref:Xylanolytic transcriptional activator regulatory domain-containing protein n=1 Tax=Rhodonia placenta TaxID=104341 RepID=A0A8H7NY54_9APHY|nr:hypothetical protein IEO21_07383 [Postia placenta]
MWAAGDRYLEDAKVILDSTYAASRPSTCQALLLMGYREVGIGAMAQAWLYVGMAVRMAQDLGLHKTADQWSCVGRVLFTPGELQERRRVWYGCVVMDKYMSAYIGRPVAIFERDFDTELPSTEEPDELETWRPHPSAPVVDDSEEPSFPEMTPMPGRILSCFSESAKLCGQSEFSRFEKLLSKWYLDLPDYLRHDPAASKNAAPLPHILTLHMQYWCTVLLLHRPFIRHISTDGSNRPTSSSSKDSETRASSRKNYDICVQAANQITSTVSLYAETHSLRRAPVYLCYYVFTAAIMHVATLMIYPDDTTARVGLNKTMDVLKRMSVVWGSAWRALELLQGSKVNLHNAQDPEILRARVPDRPKRSAEQPLDQEEDDSTRLMTSEQMYRQQQAFAGVGTPSPVHPNFSISSLQIPPAESSTYHSYDRWSSDNTLPTYAGSLSTSVLPQQYSTGLVDERISSGMTRHPERQGQRYPQYWNDYSALGQMDASYGVPVISDMVAQHAGNSQSDQSAMYVQDYTMFGLNIPPQAICLRLATNDDGLRTWRMYVWRSLSPNLDFPAFDCMSDSILSGLWRYLAGSMVTTVDPDFFTDPGCAQIFSGLPNNIESAEMFGKVTSVGNGALRNKSRFSIISKLAFSNSVLGLVAAAGYFGPHSFGNVAPERLVPHLYILDWSTKTHWKAFIETSTLMRSYNG